MPPLPRTAPETQALFLLLNDALPQTQCTRCGFPDCTAYARAMAEGQAAINQCPPGGQAGIERLAAISGQPVLPLNPEHGAEGPRHVAIIDEAWCIGCTLCIKACPTDAILGANQQMHTVIEPWCTGCELCIPVCPVDCIALENVTNTHTGWAAWSDAAAKTASQRYQAHKLRLQPAHKVAPQAKLSSALTDLDASTPGDCEPMAPSDAHRKRAIIQAAIAKASARKDSA